MSQSRRHRHLSISIRKVRRHRGDSFPRQVAYIGRTTAANPRTGRRYSFQQEGPVEATGVVGWSGSTEALIAAAVSAEKRTKAVEGRVAIVALPHEFTPEQRLATVLQGAEYLASRHGVAVVFAIHPPPEGGNRKNFHTHLLFSSRRVVGNQALGEKAREFDSFAEGPQTIEKFRSAWCEIVNEALLAAGHQANIEHRSFRRLGIAAEPSQHLGERRVGINRRRAAKLALTAETKCLLGSAPSDADGFSQSLGDALDLVRGWNATAAEPAPASEPRADDTGLEFPAAGESPVGNSSEPRQELPPPPVERAIAFEAEGERPADGLSDERPPGFPAVIPLMVPRRFEPLLDLDRS